MNNFPKIIIGTSWRKELNKIFVKSNSKFLIIIDSNLKKFYHNEINGIKQLNNKVKVKYIKFGEKSKSIENVLLIINILDKYNFNRKDFIISLGGGVIGDLTGFIGSIYKRGINFIQIPTTLLAMLDSSVGGKTAINFNNVKNLIGSFYNAKKVIIDFNFLYTLSEEHKTGGFIEGYKHSLIGLKKKRRKKYRSEYFNILNNKINNNFGNIIKDNIEVKKNMVKEDFKETMGKREWLNFGHTFGHALESVLNFKLSHGICVGFGIIFENILSKRLNLIKKSCYSESINYLKPLLDKYFKKHNMKNIKFENLFLFFLKDKKNNNNQKIKWSLLTDFGNINITEYQNKKELKKIYDKFLNIFK